ITKEKFPFWLSVFSTDASDGKARRRTRNLAMKIFAKIWPGVENQIYFENTLRPVIATLIEKPELTIPHIRRLFYDPVFRQQYTKNLTYSDAVEFWEDFEQWKNKERE